MKVLISKERLRDNFIQMVKINSPSKEEKDMADFLVSYLKDRGIETSIDNVNENFGGNSGNVLAYIKGDLDLKPICFQAHMDQVMPCIDVNPIVDGNIIKTDGKTTLGGDDKAGIAAILEALEDILESGEAHRDIYLLFTVCEEVGMYGAKNFDTSKLPVEDILILDAEGKKGVMAYKAPARVHIDMSFHGQKAHAGIEPEKGKNAILVAADAISNMRIGRIDKETTSNLGRVEGGDATNIVTDLVNLNAEIRTHSEEKMNEEIKHMEKCCKDAAEKFGVKYSFKHEKSYPSFELSKDSYIYRLTKKAMEEVGINPNPMVIGGGSDGNIFAGKGYNSLIISLGMYRPHTLEEYLDLDDLYDTTKLVSYIMKNDI